MLAIKKILEEAVKWLPKEDVVLEEGKVYLVREGLTRI
jgi:hypothetical protein